MSTGINIVGQEKLVSGTNIKTINGNSLLGSGDLVISGGGLPTTITSPQNNDALYYNQATSTWNNVSPQADSRLLYQVFELDFLSNLSFAPFGSFAISGGSATSGSSGTIGGIGVVILKSGTAASSGVGVGNVNGLLASVGSPIRPRVGQIADFVFKTPSAIAPFSTIRIGFYSLSGSPADTVNGFYIQIFNGNVFGVTATGGIRSATPTGLIGLSVNTWYHARITHNDTFITYEVYNQAGGLLWTDTLSTNIPSITQSVSMGVQAFADTSNTAVTDLIILDYMSFLVPVEPGTRGALS
jgi:hypothetical protein